MVEPEVAYATVEDMMDLAEQMISFMVQRVLSHRTENSRSWNGIFPSWRKSASFPRITYDQAIEIPAKNGSEIQWGTDFGGGDETIVSQQIRQTGNVSPLPCSLKAFYMEPDPADQTWRCVSTCCAPKATEKSLAAVTHVELTRFSSSGFENTSASRSFEWYLDLRKYGSVPHRDSAWDRTRRDLDLRSLNTCGKPLHFHVCCIG
jgi:asparaginyl-tRNA synthetase